MTYRQQLLGTAATGAALAFWTRWAKQLYASVTEAYPRTVRMLGHTHLAIKFDANGYPYYTSEKHPGGLVLIDSFDNVAQDDYAATR